MYYQCRQDPVRRAFWLEVRSHQQVRRKAYRKRLQLQEVLRVTEAFAPELSRLNLRMKRARWY